MVKLPRRAPILAGLGLLAAAWLILRPGPTPPASRAAAPARRGRATTGPDEIPRIDLARIDALAKLERVETPARDLSAYPTPPPPPPAPPPPEAAPMPVAAAPTGPPPPPPLNMTYLGNLEKRQGLKVAVFLTDKKIILYGREGDIVGSRVRVTKIGLESVDVEDLTSGRSQRMALPKKGGGTEAAKDTRDKEPTRDKDREPGGNSR
jgi:hypothetical protein